MRASVKTLVVAPNWIGDALMAQPLFRALKREPGTTLTLLAPPWVAPVLAAMAEVDAVIEADLAHGRLQWSARRDLARRLGHDGFERAFILPNSLKSALIPWLARIPLRVGYRGEARAWLLTRSLPNPARSVSMPQRYLELARAGAVPLEVAQLGEPRLDVPEATRAAVLARFGIDATRPIYALCPGAEYGPAKRWPTAHFAELALGLATADATAQVLLLGSRADRPIAQEIVALGASNVRVLAGETNLPEAIAILAAARAVVSNDSGLMHVAAALARPQVAVFGSTDPRHTPPMSRRAQVLWLHLECSPCFRRTCPLGHLRCLKDIDPTEVRAALETALGTVH